MRKAVCGAILLAASAAAQSVEGTVVDTVRGNGIAAAQVFLTPATTASENAYSATADALGHFRFESVKTGSYHFGYVSPGYFPSDPMAGTEEIRITSDDKPVKLNALMTPLARISGRVVDGEGKGVAKALLEIAGQQNPPMTTDAMGRFELRPLPGGSYILSVLPPAGIKPPDPEPGSDLRFVWTRTFYPGVDRLDAASRIVLAPGKDLQGIVLKLLGVPSHAVRGVLLNPDGTPAPKVMITLGEKQDPASGRPMFKRDPARTLRAETNSDGAFEFAQVADGEWRVAAEVESGGSKRRAAQWIEMAGRELEDVKLRLADPFPVRGEVIVETADSLSPPNPFPIFLVPHGRTIGNDTDMSNWMLWPWVHFEALTPDGARAQADITTNTLVDELGSIEATQNSSRNFTLEDVYPGTYRIVSLPPPPPYYMASVRIGDAELTTAEVSLSSGIAPITVIYKTKGGLVRGTAEKCAAGIVILIPQEAARQSLPFFRTGRCDPNDRYEITGLRPGDYSTLAFAGPGGVPQLDEILLSQSLRITIHADETTSADLHAIQRPGH